MNYMFLVLAIFTLFSIVLCEDAAILMRQKRQNRHFGGGYGRPYGQGGFNFNNPLGNPGRPVQNNYRPHHPAIPALFNALYNAYSGGGGGYNYGGGYGGGYHRPTQSPVFYYQPNGPNGRPAYGFVGPNTQIFVRNKQRRG